MKTLKLITSLVIASTLCLLLYSCGKSDTYVAPAVTDTSSVHKINITATQFDPASLTILLGTKLTWTNADTDAHSVVSDDLTSFNSGAINAGGTFSFTPVTTGTFNYHCGVHPSVKGVIYVVIR